MAVNRHRRNPIITPQNFKPSRPDFEVVGAFNAAVTRYNDQVLLLLRVAERPIRSQADITATTIYDPASDTFVNKEFSHADPRNDLSDPRMIYSPAGKFLTSFSHFRVATSDDGINFHIPDTPAFAPARPYESFGIEDPRITRIGDTYYIDYVAVSNTGVTTALASTKDFKTFTRHGIIFCPDNKDVTIFPEKINGKFYALHRPVTPLFEKYEIWLAQSENLTCWGNHQHIMATQPNLWDCLRIGPSAVPFRIEQGWLEIYHGVDENLRYCLGAVLLDADNPAKIIARSKKPILAPETKYELEGFFGNVVFNCGLLFEDDKLKIYYGVADTSIAYVEIDLNDVLKNLEL